MPVRKVICEIGRRTPDVRPYLHPLAERVLQDKDFFFRLKAMHHGPIHVIFPQIMQENIRRMQEFFTDYAFQTRIHYTCKPNKSRVFLKEAFKGGINVDVSSVEELSSALSVGFRGNDIGCTNLKNVPYLRLAIEHGCMISVDNFSELKTIVGLQGNARYKDKCRILLRISDLEPKDRQMVPKISKFGIAVSDIPEVMAFISCNKDVFDFHGVHFHHDNPLADLHAGYIDHALTLIEEIESGYGLSSRIVNIGGGLRVANVASNEEWSSFVEHIMQGLTENQDTGTWNNQAYGMKLADTGKAGGRTKLESRGKSQSYTGFLREVFENTRLRGHALHRVISDSLLSLMVEPGASLLGHAGLTLMHVNGTKDLANCDHAVFVDGNIYNISGQFMEPLTDFIHLPKMERLSSGQYDAYIIDNLCNERGVLSQKCMYFDQQPEEGDLIVIPNTAAYLSDFEDASPHMHPQGKKFVVTLSDDGKLDFCDEQYYSNFVQV